MLLASSYMLVMVAIIEVHYQNALFCSHNVGYHNHSKRFAWIADLLLRTGSKKTLIKYSVQKMFLTLWGYAILKHIWCGW